MRNLRYPRFQIETFAKCSILFKFKSKIPDFERGKTKILTTDIHFSISRIELKLHFVQNAESDAEIGQKGAFSKVSFGLTNLHGYNI